MQKAYLLLAFALAASAAAIFSSASPPAADKIARCSLQNREFWYYAPATLSPLRPAPLVLSYFWGEADHPLVCAELPDTLAWLKQWQPRFCLLEELPGGHQPHAARAALWFVSAAQIIR